MLRVCVEAFVIMSYFTACSSFRFSCGFRFISYRKTFLLVQMIIMLSMSNGMIILTKYSFIIHDHIFELAKNTGSLRGDHHKVINWSRLKKVHQFNSSVSMLIPYIIRCPNNCVYMNILCHHVRLCCMLCLTWQEKLFNTNWPHQTWLWLWSSSGMPSIVQW